ncbi:uncharacterized protein LOC102617577 isoform X2 [Citrus sinensis]|nr:uncharacterized protein LOC102617577 isoform X2 [Citrus sinensis]XP_052292263.1 uncharacterized protein LOC102617577 isoform X2 [Citrus sinensis]
MYTYRNTFAYSSGTTVLMSPHGKEQMNCLWKLPVMIFKFSTPFKNLAFPSQSGNPPTTSIIKRWSLVNFLMAIKIFEIIIKLTRGKELKFTLKEKLIKLNASGLHVYIATCYYINTWLINLILLKVVRFVCN